MLSRARMLLGSVFVLGLLAPALPAQMRRPNFIPPESSSHKRLGGGLEDLTDAESALADRLAAAARLRDLSKALGNKRLDGDLAKLAGKLLRDEKFLESLKGQVSREDIDRLRHQFREGKLTANDKGFRDLLDKAKQSPEVDQSDRAALDEFAQKLPELARPDGGRPPEKADENVPDQPKSPEVTGSKSQQGGPSRADDWLKGEVSDFIKDLDKWGETPAGKSWAETLKKFAGRIESGRTSTANLGERSPAVTRWLGRMGDWDAGFRSPSLGTPSVPNVGVPPDGSLAGAGGVLVVLLAALVLGLILWRGRDWLTSLTRAGRSAWKLGPWPVRPEDVTTRGDIVRAFEYLALLRLGPAARMCHHLELGERIGGQPALDAERRRESATALSRIYERARYTPDLEPLPGEDLRRARRELAYLAGASA